MSVHVSVSIDSVAMEIAKRLKEINDAEREKIVLQNKLDVLSEEETLLRERINKIDGMIASNKYEINASLFDVTNLSLAKKD